MKRLLKRYRAALIALAFMLLLAAFNRSLGLKALSTTGNAMKQMLLNLPPVFVMLGLLNAWVPRETMMKYMGEGSGIKGVLLSILFGSVAAGPLYGAFPIAAIFMKKGVKFTNILIFIGAWSTTKIPMFLFEMASLGKRFAITRLLIDIPGIVIIAFVLSKAVSKKEIEELYQNAEALE